MKLGHSLELWRLSRPRAAIIVATSPLLGYWFGLWEHESPLRNAWDLPWLLLGWGALHVGSIWLNACLDRDQGTVLWGAPQRIPPGTQTKSMHALVLAIVLSSVASPRAGLIASAAVVLTVLYSHPRWAWKSRPLAGPAVNLLGYGILSPAAGWVIADVPGTPCTLAVVPLVASVALSIYFLAQAFQEDEDRRRGYRTLVVTHGPAGVVMASRWCLAAAFFGLATMSMVGLIPWICGLTMLGWWSIDRWLRDRGERVGEREVRVFVRKIIVLGALAVLLAFLDHAVFMDFERGRW